VRGAAWRQGSNRVFGGGAALHKGDRCNRDQSM